MNIAVISDSHDNVDNLKSAVKIANEKKCEYLFHLGDMVSPFSAKELSEFKGIVYGVFGNCDGEHQGLTSAFNQFGGTISKAPFKIEVEGKKMVLMHEPYLLDEIAVSAQFDFVFYGHLHKIDLRKVGNTFILNPGELGGWLNEASFYIFDPEKEEFNKMIPE